MAELALHAPTEDKTTEESPVAENVTLEVQDGTHGLESEVTDNG